MSYPHTYDPVWHLREHGFNPDHVSYYESIFALGNGYLGTRGSLEESVRRSSPATFIAGLYDKAPEHVPELPTVANWLGVGISIEGESVSLENTRVLEHERILDLQGGVLYRKSLFQLNANRQLQIFTRRFVSIVDPHLVGIEYNFSVLDPHLRKVRVVLRTGLDGNVTNEGREHFSVVESGSMKEDELFICQKTLRSGHATAIGTRIRFFKDHDAVSCRAQVQREPKAIAAECGFDVETNSQYRMEKITSIYTSRESSAPKPAMIESLTNCRSTFFHTHVERHTKAWAQRWENSDIEVKGDDFAQLALRFSIFHLLQASSESDDRISIPAKALTGFGYNGHIFWDTDIFILPYLTITNPLLTRNMLTYRYYTLPEAKKRAAEKGYRGALFAWESADTGEETTPKFVKHLKENRIVRIWSGDNEQHISSDVAYSVWEYVRTTNDTEFLLRCGAEIIFETARFWSSRAEYNATRDAYEIREVIGPDEYHENIDNNYYTNAMAQWNMRKGVDLYSRFAKGNAPDWEWIIEKIALDAQEVEQWRIVADKMYIHVDDTTNVYVQFDGFMELDDIDLKEYESRTQPMDVVLGPDRISKSKISKQADVLMMLSLFRDDYSLGVKRANWDFYAPLCAHGSSLSPAMHSLLASDLGLTDIAYNYFVQSAGIDLRDKMGNSGHGIHAATAGGLLQAAIYGFAGIRITEDGAVANPRLPRHWESMKFHVWCHGKRIPITINR